MGYSEGVICTACGHRFIRSEGGGFAFDLLHCDRCGRERRVPREQVRTRGRRPVTTAEDPSLSIEERLAGRCPCGGQFRLDAPARCPKCRSDEYQSDPEGYQVMYD